MRVSALVIALLVAPVPLFCQGLKKEATPEKQSHKEKERPPTPREVAGQLLDAAYYASGSARPDFQPFLLWRVAEGYSVFNAKKAHEILDQAFAEAGGLQGFAEPAGSLQGQIAISMSALDLTRASEMVRAIAIEPPGGPMVFNPRRSAGAQIVQRLLEKQKVDAAIELINSVGSGASYPFEGASAVLSAIDSPDDGRRVIVFGNALTAYQTSPSRDFGQLVAKHWQKLPRVSVEQALDSIVNTTANYKDEDLRFRILYSGAKGTAELPSQADIELFDIIEPLTAYEPAKAKEVLEARPALKRAAELFPGGSSSKAISGMSMSMAKKGAGGPDPNDHFAISITQYQRAVDAASKDLRAGLNLLPGIPDDFLRAGAMIEIARNGAASDPTVSRDLLNKAVALLAKSSDYDGAYQQLSQAVSVAETLKEATLIEECLDEIFAIAGKLFVEDANPDDPNVMPFDYWPSSNAYREGIISAHRIYGIDASRFLDRVKNPDMFLLCQVELADAILGKHVHWDKASVHLKSQGKH